MYVTAVRPERLPTSGVLEPRFPGVQRVESDVLFLVLVVCGFFGFMLGFVQDVTAVEPLEFGDEPVSFAGRRDVEVEVWSNFLELCLSHFT